MNPAPPAKAPVPKLAADIARPLNLSDAGRALVAPTHTARQYLDALTAANHHDDALRFLAAALPKRESVWWGICCVKEAMKTMPEPQAKALAAAERWVKDPNDANRRAAGATSDVSGVGNPPGALALGAFVSGGSLAPTNVPAVPPREDLTGQAVGGALVLASITHPETSETTKKRFLALGGEIAAGKNRW